MAQAKNKLELKLQQLIEAAKKLNLEVRAEKLMREAGYRVHSGRCRVNDQELILIDRDLPIGEQVEFLAAELAKLKNPDRGSTEAPPDRK
ncbi:MAG TPA: hypothetical protein VNM15_10055 [Candidatus Binatia bacterium]|nr:hypothetical protein [Candidatus Binatia bacterium]